MIYIYYMHAYVGVHVCVCVDFFCMSESNLLNATDSRLTDGAAACQPT